MEYLAYIETFWEYFPYIFYTFIFLTFLPKSLGKIKSFAAADYEANRNKYHRCYSPDVCCHSLSGGAPKPKARKAVTRVYPKRQQQQQLQTAAAAAVEHDIIAPTIKRQVQASAIQTHTHVNQIAKMFESGVNASKKINRVPPTIYFQDTDTKTTTTSRFTQLLQENIENSVNLLNTTNTEPQQQQQQNGHDADADDCNWRTEPMSTIQRRRSRPSTLMYAGGGTSATPSTASPVESTSPMHSGSSSPVPTSPVLLRKPALTLNMKSSLEDIFAAIARNAESTDNFIYSGCNTLSPVTSIDDILSQRRLSRPLSAYSISDLLNEETNSGLDETYVENFLRTLNKT